MLRVHFFIAMTVSIIVPVHNQEHLLFRALESIPNRKDIEIIVVDDASTDRTWEKLNEWVKNNPERNVKICRNETNRGVGYTRNVALDHASFDYIYGVDSDDYLYTDRFVESLSELDGTDIIYVAAESNDGMKWFPNEWNKYEWGAFWLKFVKRAFIGKVRCPFKRWAEDKEFNAALLVKNPKVKRTGLVVYHYNHPRKGSLCWIDNYGTDAGS